GRLVRRRAVRSLLADPRGARDHPAAPGRRPLAAPGLPRRPPSWLRHRQAPQPRQERDRRVTRGARCEFARRAKDPRTNEGPVVVYAAALPPGLFRTAPIDIRRRAGVNSART